MRIFRMRESDILIILFVITGKMVKIFENNSKIIVTTIFCIIYWCEVNAATNSTTDVVHSSNTQSAHPRRGHKRRMTTTEDKSYHPKKRRIVYKADKEKNVPRSHYHRKRKPRDSSHDEHTEKWSIEEVISGLSEESLEPPTKFKIYLKETTAKDLQERKGGGHYVQRHHQDRDQQRHRKNIGARAINWLLDAIDSEEKRSLVNQSESEHEDASTTTKILYTKALKLEEEHIASERSPDKKRKKILGDPTGNWGLKTTENYDTSKTAKYSKLRDKLNSNENVKTFRYTKALKLEEEHIVSERSPDKKRKKILGDPTGNWGLKTTENYDTSKTAKYSKLRDKSNSNENVKTFRYTNALKLEEEHIVSERSPDKKRKKILGDPTGNWGLKTTENYDTSKTAKYSKLRDKSNSNENVKTFRAEGYETEYKNYQQEQLEDNKYLWSSEIEIEPNDPTLKYIQTKTEHRAMKPQYIEDKNKHRGPIHQHSEDEKKHIPPKHQYSEDKKKHRVSKHHKFEDKREDSDQNFEVEREHSALKDHSKRIHTENNGDRSKNQASVLGREKEQVDEAIRLMKLKTKLSKDRDSNKFRFREIYQAEQDKRNKSRLPYKKIKAIRKGSREDPSSEIENAETTTKRLKLRNKSKHKKRDSLNLLRSTRMPSAYELQDETPGGQNEHIPNSSNEELSPYAMEQQMRRFADKYIRDSIANVTIEVIGRTVEYNSIILLKMTEILKNTYLRAKPESKYTDEKPEKKIIFIVHGLSVAGMKGILNDVSSFNTLMKMYVRYLDKFDIFVIPMANPDGYAATLNSHSGSYSNKNLSPQSDCPGVVLDRNFDVAWNSSLNISSCSHLYPGPIPFSEAETRAVRDVFHQYSHKLMAYIHVHASTYDLSIFKGDAILYPRGYSDAQTDDDKYIDLKGEVEETMKNASFQVLSVAVDTLYNWYGKVSGSSVDYASSVYGIPYAMEFVMQLYEYIQHHALTHIWGRLIPTVFKSILKNLNTNPDDMK